MNLSKQQTTKFVFKILSIALILFFGNLQLAKAQDTSLWSIKVANYLNLSEAAQELQRLNSLGFDGQITKVLENDTPFHQLRIGCFLNETTANIHLPALKTQLYYPSLSSTQQYSETTPSQCLGYETGIILPEKWQMISTDEVFLVAITLLEYEQILGFNGDTWHSFQYATADSEIENWSSQKTVTNKLICEQVIDESIYCTYDNFRFNTYLKGTILWQGSNTVLYQDNKSINVIRIETF